MPMKKSFSKSKNTCKVTFNYDDPSAQNVCLVGDFNDWNASAQPMKKSRGGFSATVELDQGRDYQYRFLVDGQRWENDASADGFAPAPYPDCQNCVVSTAR